MQGSAAIDLYAPRGPRPARLIEPGSRTRDSTERTRLRIAAAMCDIRAGAAGTKLVRVLHGPQPWVVLSTVRRLAQNGRGTVPT